MRPAGSSGLALPRSGRNNGASSWSPWPAMLKIGADALRGLRVDRQGFAPAALADHAQRIEAPVLVKVADIQRGDLRAAESDLQADGQNGAVAQTGERVGRRRVEHFARLRLSRTRRCCLRRD